MKLLVFDSNSILNRAFYGIKLLSTKDGQFTNAIYGFLNISLMLIEEQKPDAVAFAFDLKAPTFRHEMFDGYKAHRKGMPGELAMQLAPLKEILTAMGYPIVELAGFEADDVMGTISRACCEAGHQCVLATGDRDSFQLINDCVSVLLAATRNSKAEYEIYDPAAIGLKYGLTPRELIDVKAIMGDASDNIPGVKGIGEKGALELVKRFGSLDNIYASIDSPDIKDSMRKKLVEEQAMAYLSRQLAEIDLNVPIESDIYSFVPAKRNDAALYNKLASLELFSVIKRLGLTKPIEALNIEEKAEIKEQGAPLAGCTPAELEAATETASEIIIEAEFAADELLTALIIINDRFCELGSGDNALFGRLAASGKAIKTTDSKALFRYAEKHNIAGVNITFDAQLAGYLLNPQSSDYSIERLWAQYGSSGEYAKDTPPGDRAQKLCSLFALLTKLIGENNQQPLLGDIEIPLARVLASMELIGFDLDTAGLDAFGQELDVMLKTAQAEIYAHAGEEFNINSPQQLGRVLFEKLGLPHGKKTKSGYSTNAEVLAMLADKHEIIGLIHDYRRVAKLKSTYVEGLLKAAGTGGLIAGDGKVHTRFNQTETRTGRISSLEPNLQNIPIRTELGSTLRKFFIAPDGFKLVDADYSQIELRVLAHMSGDENMTNAFLSGEDIHTATAAEVFDMPPIMVTPLMRSRAKAVNFGIVYGIGARTLSMNIGVSYAEADRYIKDYLKTFAGVKSYMDNTIENAKKAGFVTTMFGRRRYLPEILAQNKLTVALGERMAMNTPIQGTAADIIKIAMIKVFNRLRQENLKSRLILQVHDELIVLSPDSEVEQVKKLLKQEMEQAASLSVPLYVDANVGQNWLEAK